MNTKTDKNALHIKIPHLSKLKKTLIFVGAIVALTVLLLNVFLNSKKKQEIAVIQKDDITLFLENLMIREDGLFTLLGSKPMTLFDITATVEGTEEAIRKEYEGLGAYLKKCNENPEQFHSEIKTLPDYNKFREICLKNKNEMPFLDHKRLWENWVHEKGPISNQLFKLTSRGDFGLFINIPNSLAILEKHYNDFSEITQLKFDVCTILDSIDDNSSAFWNMIFKNHYLFGLIMGYGQKNSFLFNWASKNSLSLNSISLTRFKELSRLNQHANVIRKKNVEVSDLEVPYFATFEIDDEDVERYSREKEKIIHFLQDKDLVPFILNQLNPKK